MPRDWTGVLPRAGRIAQALLFAFLFIAGLVATASASPQAGTDAHGTARLVVIGERTAASSGTPTLPQQNMLLADYNETYAGTCEEEGPGSWAVNTAPVNGVASSGDISKTINGGSCPGDYFSFAAIFYTWTGSKNGQYSDSFSATWTGPDGRTEGGTYTITVVDGQITNIAKTMGTCTCPLKAAPAQGGSASPLASAAMSSPGVHEGDQSAGDPVDVASGNLFEQATDYTTAGQNPMALIRYYNSFEEPTTTVLALTGVVPFGGASDFGGHWRTNYDRFLAPQSATVVNSERPDGRTLIFTQTGGVWTTDSDVNITLTESSGTWTLTDSEDTVETYATQESSGLLQLTTITARGGYTQTLSYNSSGQLTTVKDIFGRELSFTYTGARLTGVKTPDNTTITYSYGISGSDGTALNLLTGVTYPTSSATSIAYSYGSFPFPYQLASMTDEDGNTYASWTYDAAGRVLTSQHAGGADLTTIVYDDANGSRTMTNALGEQETESFSALQGVLKISEITRTATSTTASASRQFTYDANGYLASSTDWNGNLTTFTNDSRGLPTKIIEASGTSVARTTAIDWATEYHVPDSIATAGITESFTYNVQGLPASRTDVSTGLKRSWSFTWNNALLASVTGPRTDVAQTTSFAYGTLGRLSGITNALGQTIQIPSSTGGGRPLTIIDPNGVTTKFSYSPRQWPLSQTVYTSGGNFTTTLSYDAAGNLTETRLPDGSYLANTYDAAHRLITTQNAIADTIAYTLDSLGDRTEDAVSRSGTTTWQHADAFDALGRVITDEGGAGQTTTIARDPNGNPVTITDPSSRVTSQAFDALNRVTTITNPAKGITSLSYDPHDRVTKVIAPNGAVTTYSYDGFGRLLQRVSPDTGTTSYAYDLADNLVQSTDASGVVTNHTYDALNRPTGTSYPGDASENVAFAYDQSGHGFGVGHLTSLSDAAGGLSLTYDARGNEIGEIRTSGSLSLATSYAYDAASRISATGYPSGNVASYLRNKAGEVTSVTATLAGASSATSILSGVTYLPFGPPSAWAWGNGLKDARSYDGDYRLDSLADGSAQNLTYSYDAADNVTGIKDGVTTSNSQSFGHDLLDRLTSATGVYGTFGWRYDSAGNRLGQTLKGSASSSYAYLSKSNVLDGISSSGTTTQVTTSAAGNIIALTPSSGSALDFGYNQAERLASATVGGTQVAAYVYDAFGERFSKALATGGSLFLHGQSGELLEEAGFTGSLNTDTIYLNGVPVADLTANATYFLHADRLGTPQVATTTTKAIAWQSAYQPFGINTGASGLFTQNLRFPGQYADAETGFYQNGFRDYNPTWGRYIESDPIGLAGGVNTFGYVWANPTLEADQAGLWALYIGFSDEWAFYLGLSRGAGITFDSSGNFGTYKVTGGGGSTPGVFAGVQIGFLGSTGADTATICDLKGIFANASEGLGVDGLYGSVGAFYNPLNPQFVGGNLSFGIGLPGVSGSVTISNTSLTNRGNIFELLR